jgi:hypothetical protein
MNSILLKYFEKQKYAFGCSGNFAFRTLRMFYDEKGNDLITSVDSKDDVFYATLIPRTSPFVDTFNEILIRIMEAGIVNYQKSLNESDSNLLWATSYQLFHKAFHSNSFLTSFIFSLNPLP